LSEIYCLGEEQFGSNKGPFHLDKGNKNAKWLVVMGQEGEQKFIGMVDWG